MEFTSVGFTSLFKKRGGRGEPQRKGRVMLAVLFLCGSAFFFSALLSECSLAAGQANCAFFFLTIQSPTGVE